MRELQKIYGYLRQPKSEDDDDDKEGGGVGGSNNNNNNGETSCSNSCNTWPAQSRPTSHFFPLFPFFFHFFLLLPFSHLGFPGRSSFRAVGRKKRDKNGTQIPGVNGQFESHPDILVASPVFYLIYTFRNTRGRKSRQDNARN